MMKFSSLVKKNTKIKDAIRLMGSSERNKYIAGIAVVVNDEGRVIGVLTDGDIRRGLSRGIGIESGVEKIANFSPVTVRLNLSKQQMRKEIIKQAKKRNSHYQKFDKIILVDEQNRFHDLVLLSHIFDEQVDYKIIAVYGMGYVGLTLACVLANSGLIVVGIDTDKSIIDKLKKGKPHFYEAGLESLLFSLMQTNPIHFVATPNEIDADIHIVTVGTPIGPGKKPDLKYIYQVSETIAQKLKKSNLIVFRSTVPVGTMRNVVIPILEKSGLVPGNDFYLSFAPERTVEGKALEELKVLPQVIGGFDHRSIELTANLFRKITNSIIEVESLEAAEMVKLINNTYRDLVFSFPNEVSNICEALNLNAFKLIDAANEGYPRNQIPKPAPGTGGICLSKDPYIYTNPMAPVSYKPILGKSSRGINANGHLYVYEKIKRFCQIAGKDINVLKIFIIGLAFKGMPETSDIRESMALKLVKILPSRQNIYIKDFVVKRDAVESIGCHYVTAIMEGFRNSDVVLVMNNHYQNNKFNIVKAINLMKKHALFFDGWNMFDQTEIERIDNVYYATMGYMTERS